jgi:putative iron-regulated protein
VRSTALLLALVTLMPACARRSPPAAPQMGPGSSGDGTDAAMAPASSDTAEAAPVAARPDRQKVLAELVRVVILPSYEALKASSADLAASLAAVAGAPGMESVNAARDSWRAARLLWRQTNAYGIGPADDLGLTSGIIDEPTDVARLERLLAAATPLDATALRSLGANQRGLLAIEYLLFEPAGGSAEVTAGLLAGPQGPRRALYLELLGADLDAKIAAVLEAWRSRYGQELAQAGRGSVEFRMERDALNALLNKALAIADRTIDVLRQATGGMTARVGLPVSSRSDHVVPDLLEDLAGLEALYTGRARSRRELVAMVSVGDAVLDMNAGADTEMRRALEAARGLLEALPRPLQSAGAESESVIRAIAALRLVKAALATGVFNALGVSIGFSDNDGD